MECSFPSEKKEEDRSAFGYGWLRSIKQDDFNERCFLQDAQHLLPSVWYFRTKSCPAKGFPCGTLLQKNAVQTARFQFLKNVWCLGALNSFLNTSNFDMIVFR